MLDPFQQQILRRIAANRGPDSVFAGGGAPNRDGPRLSRDLDLFHRTVAMIDAALARDLASLRDAGFVTTRLRETATSREWLIASLDGAATRVQWTRETSWLFFPAVPDPEFGYMLSFEDLAVNKMAAAADRGRIRDYHDLAALDLLGVPPWVLALASMGKDAELSPPTVLDQPRRLVAQAGVDDEDPDYEGPCIPWPVLRRHMHRRLQEDLDLLGRMEWIGWAGVLPIDPATGRLALHLTPKTIEGCGKARASLAGSWPSSPALAGEMLRAARHPALRAVRLDLDRLIDPAGRAGADGAIGPDRG